MTQPESSNVESALWDLFRGQPQSASHDEEHIKRVLTYALKLADKYGGDRNVLIAAVMFHDLGRSYKDLHGADSRQKSVEDARGLLASTDLFNQQEIESILTAIDEHDQAELRPSTIEGQILKESDFLAGFGAEGVVRSAIWVGESTQESDNPREQFLLRLDTKMPARIRSLQFPESRRMAKRLNALPRYFSHELKKDPDLTLMDRKGTYIIFEGISGSGKDTQASLLKQKLIEHGKKVKLVNEPTKFYRRARILWKDYLTDPLFQTYLIMADRRLLLTTKVKPALKRDQVVLSVRSYPSTMAYQGSKTDERELIELAHLFVPIPEAVFILDLPPKMAYERCVTRSKEKKRLLGEHETPDRLTELRGEYINIAKSHVAEDFVILDGSQPEETIHQQIWAYLVEHSIFTD